LIREGIPNKAGNFGVSNRISRKIYFGSMLPFININHFRLVPLKIFKVKYSKRKHHIQIIFSINLFGHLMYLKFSKLSFFCEIQATNRNSLVS
jgi:hypothetical protein